MTLNYIEVDGKPVPETDFRKWSEFWTNIENRRVALDEVGESTVSTVFLGIDHGIDPSRPELYETLVRGGPLSEEMDRYATREEALAGHQAMCERVRQYGPTRHCPRCGQALPVER